MSPAAGAPSTLPPTRRVAVGGRGGSDRAQDPSEHHQPCVDGGCCAAGGSRGPSVSGPGRTRCGNMGWSGRWGRALHGPGTSPSCVPAPSVLGRSGASPVSSPMPSSAARLAGAGAAAGDASGNASGSAGAGLCLPRGAARPLLSRGGFSLCRHPSIPASPAGVRCCWEGRGCPRLGRGLLSEKKEKQNSSESTPLPSSPR